MDDVCAVDGLEGAEKLVDEVLGRTRLVKVSTERREWSLDSDHQRAIECV